MPGLVAPDLGGSGSESAPGLSLGSGSKESNIDSVSLLWVNKPCNASSQPIEKGCSPLGRGRGGSTQVIDHLLTASNLPYG